MKNVKKYIPVADGEDDPCSDRVGFESTVSLTEFRQNVEQDPTSELFKQQLEAWYSTSTRRAYKLL